MGYGRRVSAQQRQLAIQFARVKPADLGLGLQWPARVVASPEGERRLSLPVDVMVEQLNVHPGQRVQQGQLLALLDSRQLRLWVNELLAADETLKQCKRRLTLLTERRSLGLASAADVQQLRSDCRLLERRVDSATSSLRHAGWQPSRIEALMASGEFKETLQLTAPVSGVVADIALVPGHHMEAGLSLLTIWPDQALRLEVSLPVALAATMAVGDQAQLTDGRLATVSAMSMQADQQNRRHLWLTADGLQPGVRQTLHLPRQRASAGEIWLVPPEAVVREKQQDWVFVRTPEGVRLQAVRRLAMVGGLVQVQGELTESSELAVSSTAALKGLWLGMGGE